MNQPLGFALVVAGVCFLVLGIHEGNSYSGGINRLVHGAAGDRTVWYFMAGTASTLIGVYLLATRTH